MTDPWRYGSHFRTVAEMREVWVRPSADPETLPQWAEVLLFTAIMVICLGLLAYGLLHPLGAH